MYRLRCKTCQAEQIESHPADGDLRRIKETAARPMQCGHGDVDSAILARAWTQTEKPE